MYLHKLYTLNVLTQCIKHNLSIIAAKSIFQAQMYTKVYFTYITNTYIYQGSENIRLITGFKI